MWHVGWSGGPPVSHIEYDRMTETKRGRERVTSKIKIQKEVVCVCAPTLMLVILFSLSLIECVHFYSLHLLY